MDLDYLVSSTENTITTPIDSGDGTPKTCFRKGDVIYYVKPDTVNMIRKNNDSAVRSVVSEARPSLASDGHTDTINSGESLFKVFTFEQSSNDEDTEKCIAFWKSVMEKNLTPIKCTIIENTKNPTPQENQKQKSLEEEPSRASSEDLVDKIHEEYRNMWLSALREIQKKKLHEIKLTAKVRCKMCDSISSSVDEYVDKVDKRALKKEIRELNNWKSKSTKKQKPASKETNSRTKTSSSDSLTKSQHSMNKKSGASTETKTVSSPASVAEKNKKNLVTDTKTYILEDVIGEKKKDGVYSKWRSSTSLGEGCQCGCQCRRSSCRCNINLASVAIVKKETDPTAANARQNQQCAAEKKCQANARQNQQCAAEKKIQAYSRNTQQCKPEKTIQGMKCSLLQCKDQAKSENNFKNKAAERNAEQKKIQADVKESSQINEGGVDQTKSQSSNFTVDDRNSTPRNIQVVRNEIQSTSALMDRKMREKMHQRQLSLFLQCVCSTSSCDCLPLKEYLPKKKDPKSDWDIPKPSVSTSVIRRNSLELYRKFFSEQKMFLQKESSFASMNVRVPQNTATSIIGNESTGKASILKLVENRPNTQPSSGKLFRTISLMLKHCRCSNEVCDCYQIETVQREHSNVSNAARDAHVRPSRVVAVKRADSLVLAKRRFSQFPDPSKNSSVQVLYPPSTFADDSSVLNEYVN